MAISRPVKPFSGMVGVEKAWGCSEFLIRIAEKSGMNAVDLETLIELCQKERLVLVVRAPGGAGRRIVGIGGVDIRPKPATMKDKTGGRWLKHGDTLYVSDYDLLSVWQRNGDHLDKFPLPADDARTDAFLKLANRELVMPFQHGANDDWLDGFGNAKNLAIGNQFLVIQDDGMVIFVEGKEDMRAYYEKNGLSPWLYD